MLELPEPMLVERLVLEPERLVLTPDERLVELPELIPDERVVLPLRLLPMPELPAVLLRLVLIEPEPDLVAVLRLLDEPLLLTLAEELVFLEDEEPANLAEFDRVAVADDLFTSVRVVPLVVLELPPVTPETLLLVGILTLVPPERVSVPEPLPGFTEPLFTPPPILPPEGNVAEPMPVVPGPVVLTRGVRILVPPPKWLLPAQSCLSGPMPWW